MTDLLTRFGWIGGLGGTLAMVSVAVVLTLDGGYLRDGLVWLLVAAGAAAWMACLVGCAYVHGDQDNLSLWSGVSMAVLGLVAWVAGWAGFFIGGLDGGANPTMSGWLVFTAIALGAIGVVLGLAVFGGGAMQAKVLPWWGRTVPLLMAASLPLATLVNRLRGERLILLNGVAFLVFAAGWIVLGLASRASYMSSLETPPPDAPSA